MKPYVVAGIFARGGSRGVPRKNIRLLASKPLIAHAIGTAQASRLIHRVIVSTDDGEIAEVARRYGAEVPFMRPVELATDDSPEWASWQHAIRELTDQGKRPIDALVSVPATSPLRAVEDVDACIERLLGSDADAVITVTPTARHPSFNMVQVDRTGTARLVVPPARPIYRRQDATPVFDMTTVALALRPRFVMTANALFQGKVKAVVVPPERALDIDTELDFAFAEFLMSRAAPATAPALSQ